MRRSLYIYIVIISAIFGGLSVMWAYNNESTVYCILNFTVIIILGVITSFAIYVIDRVKFKLSDRGGLNVGVLTICHILCASVIASWGFTYGKLVYSVNSNRIDSLTYCVIATLCISLYGMIAYLYEKRKKK